MVLVFSSEPTKTTSNSHRVTHALFEWIDKKSTYTGELVFPDVLLGLNHEGLEFTLKQSKSLKLWQDTAPIHFNHNDDMLRKLIKFGVDNNSKKEMTRINDTIDMLKQEHGISVRKHLGFGNAANEQLKFYTDKYGFKRIGELNSANNLHGRGILINILGTIWIQYWNNGDVAPGNYLKIWSDGDVSVGECYFKDGELRDRGTIYKTDGTSVTYDW